ncbi:hypothetical protein [Nitrosomonas sp.]|uniref:hypothetical protein n=1 Tax=Nitrosomonas sp. TaxID=42353 RepID=UPI001E13E165|nr:hypothetical protein [Nitrosomonas sp.]MBX9635931.1 hypothetical protein [Nitrosomonas sp.]MBY0485351.1 hypothetical protein [Nitrosomonas sp.]
MPKNINSASRLFKILEQAQLHGKNKTALEVWAEILDVSEKHSHRRVVAVGELVHAMHRELEHATAELATGNFSKNLYERAFSQIEHALSPMLFPNSWDHVKQYLTPEVLTALAFCTEILPDEEAQISAEEISSIRIKVEELRTSLNDIDMPLRLRSLIQHHIKLIENALAEYPVVGAKALREAARTALGEMIEAKDEIAVAKNSSAVATLGSVWKTVNQAADVALKAEKIAQLGQRAWDTLNGIL